MKTFKRALAAACCIAMLSATACSDGTVVKEKDKQVEITFSWWGNDDRDRYTIEAIEKFEEQNPNITVKVSYSEWASYEMRNKVAMISDTEADVMQINYGWLDAYSADGTGYYDLNELSDTLALDNFDDVSLKYGEKNGILNAVPIAMNAETVYINKTLYDKYGQSVPETWDDLFKAANAMRRDGIYPISAASKSLWIYLIAYAEQVSGKNFVNDSGELSFSTSEFQAMMEFYKRLVDEKVLPLVEKYERLGLTNGQYAGSIAWISDAANYFGESIEAGNEIVCADYTTLDGKSIGQGWYAKPATMYAISKNTEHPKEAAMLLDFLLNSEEMSDLQGIEKGIPLSAAALKNCQDDNMLQGIQYDASLKMTGVSLAEMAPIMENGDLIDAFFAAANDYIYSKSDAFNAAKGFYEQAQKDYFS